MEDRRIQKTKTALRQALLALVAERGYDNVSVQQIVDRANVGRSTFYSHFADKEDLLQEGLRELVAFIRSSMAESSGNEVHPALRFCVPMLEHVAEARPIFAALQQARAVNDLFLDALRDLSADGLEAATIALPKELVTDYLAATFQAVVRWWVVKAPDCSVAQVNQTYLDLVAPTLQRIDRRENQAMRSS
jgi:AcrR family transcriptional regulator